MNNPLKAFLWLPALPLLWCGLQFHILGHVPKSSQHAALLMLAICLAVALLFSWGRKKALSNRLHLDMRLNTVATADGEVFTGAFSSDTRFLADLEALHNVIRAVAGRESHTQGRSIMWREAALVRIWPGPSGLTPLELDVVTQALADEFAELEVLVMDSTAEQINQGAAITAERPYSTA
jgi:hypothetical protein